MKNATAEDIAAIKKISDQNTKSIGFVTRAVFEEAIRYSGLKVIELDNKIVGFQHYYHRKKDQQTTFYQKAVLTKFRRKNLANILVQSIINECKKLNREFIQLKCPQDLESNLFHKQAGFQLYDNEKGKKRNLNVWRLYLN